MIIIIPLPLFFAQTIYGTGGLTAWVVIGIIWAFMSAFSVVIYPLYESREALLLVARGVIKVWRAIVFGITDNDLDDSALAGRVRARFRTIRPPRHCVRVQSMNLYLR